MKRTCWAIGNWRCCLSREVASTIPAGSTIIHWVLCGFICDSLCQLITIKPINMYIARAKVQFKINTPVDTCAFQTGRQLYSAVPAMSLGLYFWHNFCGMKPTCRTIDSWWCCLSLEFDPCWFHDISWVPLWVYMRFPMPEHHNQTYK